MSIKVIAPTMSQMYAYLKRLLPRGYYDITDQAIPWVKEIGVQVDLQPTTTEIEVNLDGKFFARYGVSGGTAQFTIPLSKAGQIRITVKESPSNRETDHYLSAYNVHLILYLWASALLTVLQMAAQVKADYFIENLVGDRVQPLFKTEKDEYSPESEALWNRFPDRLSLGSYTTLQRFANGRWASSRDPRSWMCLWWMLMALDKDFPPMDSPTPSLFGVPSYYDYSRYGFLPSSSDEIDKWVVKTGDVELRIPGGVYRMGSGVKSIETTTISTGTYPSDSYVWIHLWIFPYATSLGGEDVDRSACSEVFYNYGSIVGKLTDISGTRKALIGNFAQKDRNFVRGQRYVSSQEYLLKLERGASQVSGYDWFPAHTTVVPPLYAYGNWPNPWYWYGFGEKAWVSKFPLIYPLCIVKVRDTIMDIYRNMEVGSNLVGHHTFYFSRPEILIRKAEEPTSGMITYPKDVLGTLAEMWHRLHFLPRLMVKLWGDQEPCEPNDPDYWPSFHKGYVEIHRALSLL